jgi:predicted 3-demethylubiquinone-9 3-methyltransferase (glyoxalase superfamily)
MTRQCLGSIFKTEREDIPMQKITPCLAFNGKAEEAVNFYISIFKNSKILTTSRNGEGGPGPKGSLLMAVFQLDGQEYQALNGGPSFTFSEGISLSVSCETQAEIDELWEKLSSGGGKHGPCGWLTDKFGVSWQIVPSIIGKLLSDKDPAKTGRVMNAVMQMGKLDIAKLKQAYEG